MIASWHIRPRVEYLNKKLAPVTLGAYAYNTSDVFAVHLMTIHRHPSHTTSYNMYGVICYPTHCAILVAVRRCSWRLKVKTVSCSLLFHRLFCADCSVFLSCLSCGVCSILLTIRVVWSLLRALWCCYECAMCCSTFC